MEWTRGETIGRGAFASINLAIPKGKSPTLPLVMAVKSCDLSHSATLINEQEVLRRLGDCPQIIRCFGAGLTSAEEEGGSDRYNLFLEYAPGGSLLDEAKRRGGRLPETEVRRHARSVLEAVKHIHSRGFVHGDIKVQNILIFPAVNGRGDTHVKVADFGLAGKVGIQRIHPESLADGRGTRFEWKGTPLNMSPEAVNENDYGPPSDVWAIGCAVVEMTTGRPAWDHPADCNIYELMMRIGVGDEIPAIPEDISEEGKDFLLKCFVKDPEKRWTAEMLLNHPFVAHHNSCCNLVISPSPRCHFDFMQRYSSIQYPWEFPSEGTDFVPSDVSDKTRKSVIKRMESLACEEMPNWEDSENVWITLRCPDSLSGQTTEAE
ncbi:hypothetical protein SAY87_009109 [Trapa incisa]|uniref:Protein kinase domain-containing protein n=1 Tax=Trapa incisa TaxID=236973 RepID=A0AAN7JY82_9MYRT|nr:hypothetical protein SAY87_009109 [Trapa incisa]